MAVTSGFFNSVDHDRLYNSEHFGKAFEGIITDGVLSTVSQSLVVEPAGLLSIKVRPGKAWFNWTYLVNDADLILSHNIAHPTLHRIDAVVLNFDKSPGERENSIMILSGTAVTMNPVAPTLINTFEHKQYPLAYVTISAGKTTVFAGDIKSNIGSDLCPLATGVLQHLSIEHLTNYWEGKFDEWFIGIQNIFDDNAETNLLTLIREYPAKGRNLIINGDMSVRQREPQFGTASSSINGYQGPDRWYTYIDSGSTYTVNHVNAVNTLTGLESKWYQVNCTSTAPGSIGNRAGYLYQAIEGYNLSAMMKGTPEARKAALSFTMQGSVEGIYCVELEAPYSNRHWTGRHMYDTEEARRVEMEIPEDFIGTILANKETGLRVRFWFSAGSSYTGGSLSSFWRNIIASNKAVGQVSVRLEGDYFRITDVQFELSPQASVFERKPVNDVLLDCKRYYEVGKRTAIAVARTSTDLSVPGIQYSVPKRATPIMLTPTCTIFNPNETVVTAVSQKLSPAVPTNDLETLDLGYTIVGGITAGMSYRTHISFTVYDELT